MISIYQGFDRELKIKETDIRSCIGQATRQTVEESHAKFWRSDDEPSNSGQIAFFVEGYTPSGDEIPKKNVVVDCHWVNKEPFQEHHTMEG